MNRQQLFSLTLAMTLMMSLPSVIARGPGGGFGGGHRNAFDVHPGRDIGSWEGRHVGPLADRPPEGGRHVGPWEGRHVGPSTLPPHAKTSHDHGRHLGKEKPGTMTDEVVKKAIESR